MDPVIVIVIALILVAAIGAGLVTRSRRSTSTITVADDVASTRPPDVPMTGLESALAQVTDRAGRPIGERIDAEAGHVDELRVPDDTGPLLRRALDHVVQPQDEPVEPGTDAAPLDEPTA